MITIRRSDERGGGDHGWLNTRHSFSFDQYYDPHYMGFRSLRVINEDWVQPGHGFPTHPHRDMEIITYLLEGSLEHKEKDESVTIHQDAKLYVSLLLPREQVEHKLSNGRYGWLQVAKGTVELNGKPLQQGDGAAISEEPKLEVKAPQEAEILLFELA